MMSRKLAWEILVNEVWNDELLKAWTEVIAAGYVPDPRLTFGVFGQTIIDHWYN